MISARGLDMAAKEEAAFPVGVAVGVRVALWDGERVGVAMVVLRWEVVPVPMLAVPEEVLVTMVVWLAD